MLQRAGRHLGDGTGESSTAPLRQNHTVGSHRFSGSDHSPEIVGIGDAIEGQQKWSLTQLLAAVDQGVEVKGVCSGRLQRDALMHRASGDLTEASPGDLLDKDAGTLGISKKLQELGCAPHFRRTPDSVNRTAGFQGRKTGVSPPDQVIGRWCGCERFRLQFALGTHPRWWSTVLAGITRSIAKACARASSPFRT